MLERSSLLADLGDHIVHGFSTRHGGVSTGRHATLNLGLSGDAAANVRENLTRLADRAGFSPRRLAMVRQVHGAAVVRATTLEPDTEGDALWLAAEDAPGVVGVRTADCLPVLLADQHGRAVAAVHSGWRGTLQGVVPATVEVLRRDAEVSAASLVVAIGPCIEWTAFEVGPEVAARFPAEFVHHEGFARPRIDLVQIVQAQLVDCGVPPEQIERVGGCTYSNPDRYFSYRRDGAGTGQHLSFIGFV